MKIVNTYIVAGLIALGGSQAALANSNITPVISFLLDSKTPAIYACKAGLLKDLNGPDSNSSFNVKAQFTNLGNLTLFFADHPDTGTEPWVTDGTPAGTHILKDINSGSANGIGPGLLTERHIQRHDNKVFFLADDGINGEELWMTDGTELGTTMVKNITGDSTASFISNLTSFNGKLYFMVADGDSDVEDEGLWVTEGTSATTQLVKDTHPSSGGSSEASTMVVLNDQLIFRADGQTGRVELWQSDGNSAGTSLLKDINPSGSSFPEQFTVVGNKAYFIANDGTHGKEIWVSNGTAAGTFMVKDINPGSARGALDINIDSNTKMNPGLNNNLYFIARTPALGDELWVTSGTRASTLLVRDIRTGSDSALGTSFPDFSAEPFNNQFYFKARDQLHGTELWRVNENGSTTLLDLDVGTSSSTPDYLAANDDYLFFSANMTFSFGEELTILDKDGRVHQLNIYTGSASSQPKYLHIRNDQSLLFVTNNSFSGPGVGLYQVECPVEDEK